MPAERMIGIEMAETGIRAARMVRGKVRLLYEEQWPYMPLYERFKRENLYQLLEESKSYFDELGLVVDKCLVSVPVGMDYNQREEVRAILLEVGFAPVRILSNISLMALAYLYSNPGTKENIILIDMRDNFTDIGGAIIEDGIAEILTVSEVPDIGLQDGSVITAVQKQKLSEEIARTREAFDIYTEGLLKRGENSEEVNREINKVVLSENCANQPLFTELCGSLISQKRSGITKQKYGTLNGLAVQAARMDGMTDIGDILLLDALHWSITVDNSSIDLESEKREKPDTQMFTIIHKDTSIPIKKSRIFEVRDKKGSVRVFQDGDRKKQIAEIPMPEWVEDSSRIEISAEVDVDGKIMVTLQEPKKKAEEKRGSE